MKKIQPFANDSEAMSIGELTLENGTDKVAVYGSLDITRDKAGLKQALALKAIVDSIVKSLSQDKSLPDQVAPPEAPQQAKNPFA